MQVRQVQEALEQVRSLRVAAGDGVRFRGYSSSARLVSGGFVVAGATRLSLMQEPLTTPTILIVWGAVAISAALLNAGALMRWVVSENEGDWRSLAPVRHMLFPLGVGILLTVGMVMRGAPDLLYGTWMCMYGLANFASRRVLPKAMGRLGAYYVILGGACLVLPGLHLGSVWAMALVFGIGELAAGAILHADHRRYRTTIQRRVLS